MNDGTPIFEQDSYTATVTELVPVGTFVLAVKASDTVSHINLTPQSQREYSIGVVDFIELSLSLNRNDST